MSRHRYSEDYPKPPELTQWGFPASFYKLALTPVPADRVATPNLLTEAECFARFRKANPGRIEGYEDDGHRCMRYGNPTKWEDICHWLDIKDLEKAFTFEELLRMFWGHYVQSEFSEETEKNPAYMLFRKVKNGMWHWGWVDDYNKFVRGFNAIRSFDFGVDGFETYIDHASWHNEHGLCQWSRQYTDGSICFNIVHKGELVLRIGICFGKHGVFFTQAQLSKKKGNRWLYKLPCHYFKHCIDRVRAAFPGVPFWIVDGASMVEHVRRSYGKGMTPPAEEVLERVKNIYDAPIEGYERTEQTITRIRRFTRLVRTKGAPCPSRSRKSTKSGRPNERLLATLV